MGLTTGIKLPSENRLDILRFLLFWVQSSFFVCTLTEEGKFLTLLTFPTEWIVFMDIENVAEISQNDLKCCPLIIKKSGENFHSYNNAILYKCSESSFY